MNQKIILTQDQAQDIAAVVRQEARRAGSNGRWRAYRDGEHIIFETACAQETAMTHPAPDSESDMHTKPAETEQVAGARERLLFLAAAFERDLTDYVDLTVMAHDCDTHAEDLRLILSAYARQGEEIERLRGERVKGTAETEHDGSSLRDTRRAADGAVVADPLTERLTKVAYATEFMDVRGDILALIERDRERWLDNIAVCKLLADARAMVANHPSGAPDSPRTSGRP